MSTVNVQATVDDPLAQVIKISNMPANWLALEVARELTRAQSLFSPIHSPHEGLAVIEEEWEEFKDEVWAFNLNKGRDTRPKMREELIQLAAMCLRTIHDVIDK